MKLLLDENLPKKLRNDFPEHEVFAVREKGWNGAKNGELLRSRIADGFDSLLTFDKNLQHQQNFETYQISVLVLTAQTNKYKDLQPLIGQIKMCLENLQKVVAVVSP